MRYITLPVKHTEISTLLSLCGRDSTPRLGASIHAAILKTPDLFSFTNPFTHRHVTVVYNSLLSMYSKAGLLLHARYLFDEMPHRDTVSWNTIFSACLSNHDTKLGFHYFNCLRRSECYSLDHATLTIALSACDQPELLPAAVTMHSFVMRSGYQQMVPVGNAMISAYFKCGCAASARGVFDEMSDRNVITWTAMVSGLAQREVYDDSLILFRKMLRCADEAPNSLTYASALLACSGLRDLRQGQEIHALVVKSGFCLHFCVESALMDVYSKCGRIDDAFRVFESCKEPDEVSLTVILAGFAQNGLEERAFELFAKMVGVGIGIDSNMVSAVLGAFGPSAPLGFGQQIHSFVVKKCLGYNIFVSNGLINMYSKCGALVDSIKIFQLMADRNTVSWNSLIAAFARHGRGSEALELYECMRSEGVQPTDFTFLSLLHACSHVGSVEQGLKFLKSMFLDHGLKPRIEHYACVVDMLGRAGRLSDAKNFIERLSIENDAVLWQALLGACSIRGDLEMGKYSAERLSLAEPENTAAYVLLSNLYSGVGRWEERAKVIRSMKEIGVKKEIGASWIEVDKEIHRFVVGDNIHPKAEVIYEVLFELAALIRDQEVEADSKALFYQLELERYWL